MVQDRHRPVHPARGEHTHQDGCFLVQNPRELRKILGPLGNDGGYQGGHALGQESPPNVGGGVPGVHREGHGQSVLVHQSGNVTTLAEDVLLLEDAHRRAHGIREHGVGRGHGHVVLGHAHQHHASTSQARDLGAQRLQLLGKAPLPSEHDLLNGNHHEPVRDGQGCVKLVTKS